MAPLKIEIFLNGRTFFSFPSCGLNNTAERAEKQNTNAFRHLDVHPGYHQQ
jgi:hypothetical protein